MRQFSDSADLESQLTALMSAHRTSLVRLAYLYLGDSALAEDAVQETFLKAWRHWESFREESAEKTWLTRIAINTCKDIRRIRLVPPGAPVPEPGCRQKVWQARPLPGRYGNPGHPPPVGPGQGSAFTAVLSTAVRA